MWIFHVQGLEKSSWHNNSNDDNNNDNNSNYDDNNNNDDNKSNDDDKDLDNNSDDIELPKLTALYKYSTDGLTSMGQNKLNKCSFAQNIQSLSWTIIRVVSL